MKNKSLLLFVLLFSAASSVSAQKTAKAKQLPSVAIGAGILSFNGDVGNGVDLSSFSRIRGGYNLTIEQRIETLAKMYLSLLPSLKLSIQSEKVK